MSEPHTSDVDAAYDTSFDGTLASRSGRGSVRSTSYGWFAVALARVLGFRPDSEVPASLSIERIEGTVRERWTRKFGDRTWTTDCERTPIGLVEWIGPKNRRLVGLVLAIEAQGDRTLARLRWIRIGPFRIEAWWLQMDVMVSRRHDDMLTFAVSSSVLGRPLLAYEGWIA